jgi:multidrug efflux pump subunit AcrB
MVSFLVGEDKEDATTRLYNKMNSNIDQKPLGVTDIQIKAIDPDEIPIFSIAITKKSSENIDSFSGMKEEDTLMLRKIALEIQEEIKHIPEVSNIYIVG